MPDAKTQTLEKTFKQPFDIGRYLTFATEFFKDVRIDSPEDESPITAVEFANVAAGIIRVGVYSSPNGETLNILAVRLHRGRSVERARSVQRNFVAREIAEHNHDAAIVAFYSDDDDRWRLSFVRLDYKFADGKFTKDLSPAKRYSYLVGKGEPCHTAIKQLLPIFAEEDYSPTLDKIEEAFSVEAVTKDFFELYKERYLDLKEQLEANKEFIKEAEEHNFTSEQFAKKLMGQIVFLYFLQKKGWLGVKVIKTSISVDEFDKLRGFSTAAAKIMPRIYKSAGTGYELDEMLFKSKDFSDADADIVASAFVGAGIDGIQKWGDGSRRFIRDLFEECQADENASNFFNDYLEHLFYEALNSKRGASHYYRRFNCHIPFLNGGLFQHEYDWAHTDFGLSDDIFSNDGGKRGEPDGILDIFDRFNFTMNEDEPLEREVAVDPEMLGKIFENLLEVSDRKSKGAFYTPREIVHYMCRETLINYLAGECQIPSADIREFILYGEQMRDCDLSIDELKYISRNVYQKLGAIDRALNDIRVADPAVGSGAFLLGMLNEIVKIQNNITEYLVAREPNKIAKDRRRADRDLYKLKWNAIKNCLYAVDIEQSAVDIAKLRLWLSLVVDAEIDEDSQSDPKTLPNLDYNIMCGNSLIDEYQGVKLFDDSMLAVGATKSSSIQHQIFLDDVEMKIKELREEQNAFFGEEDPDRKKTRKKRIDALVDDVIITKLKMENKSDLIEDYLKLKETGSMPFFLWGLEFARVFQDKGGFDVVIGNPPYIGESGHKELFREVKKTAFGAKFHYGKMDYFYFFIHKGLDILKNDGDIAFITTNYFLTATGGKKLREDIKNRTYIRTMVNFNDIKVFESALGQHNMISIFSKNKQSTFDCKVVLCDGSDTVSFERIKNILNEQDKDIKIFYVKQDNIFDGDGNYIRQTGVVYSEANSIGSIVNKLSCIKQLLSQYVNIDQGVVSGCDYVSSRNIGDLDLSLNIGPNDGIFVFNTENERDKQIIASFNDEERSLLKPFFKNSEIHRYHCNTQPTRLLLYINKNVSSLSQYPNIKRHMDRFMPILKRRREAMTGKIKYFQLQWSRKQDIFLSSKIIVPYRTTNNAFAYNNIPWYCRSDVYVISPKDEAISLFYLLGVLNSSLIYIWLYNRGKRKGALLELFQEPLANIPIMRLPKPREEEIAELAMRITDLKNTNINSDTLPLENRINEILIDAYAFSEEERRIIQHVSSIIL